MNVTIISVLLAAPTARQNFPKSSADGHTVHLFAHVHLSLLRSFLAVA